MKKRISLVLAVTLALSVTACGPSASTNDASASAPAPTAEISSKAEEAEKTEEMSKEEKENKEKAEEVDSFILAIMDVSLESEKAISDAKEAYDKLTKEQKDLVENYADLEAAVLKFDELNAEEVEKLIDEIGEVSLDSGKAIEKAQKAYDDLTDDQKKMVENYEDLEASLKDFDNLSIENTENLINAIGEVSLESADAIRAARMAYKDLTYSQKKEITSYEVLKDAEKTLEALREEEKRRQMAFNVGDTVTSSEWNVTLTNAYTSDIIESPESSLYVYSENGYPFCVLEFDVTCLTSNHPTIDDDAITNIVATVNGNTYTNWTYQYIDGGIWRYIRHSYLDANLPLHVIIYTNIPSIDNAVTVDLKIAGQEKIISIN